MDMRKSIATCYAKYATFRGRASRSEFWWFYLFLILFPFVFGIVVGVLALLIGETEFTYRSVTGGLILLGGLFFWGSIIPLLSAGARRLHDTGRSGHWQWLFLSPILSPLVAAVLGGSVAIMFLLLTGVGSKVVLIFFYSRKGSVEVNKYGDPPLDNQIRQSTPTPSGEATGSTESSFDEAMKMLIAKCQKEDNIQMYTVSQGKPLSVRWDGNKFIVTPRGGSTWPETIDDVKNFYRYGHAKFSEPHYYAQAICKYMEENHGLKPGPHSVPRGK